MKRRAVTWTVVVLGIVVGFIYFMSQHGLGGAVAAALYTGVAITAWILAVLFWDLAIVWHEYVANRRYLTYLEHRWIDNCVKEKARDLPPPERSPRQLEPGIKSFESAPAAEPPPAGIWWLAEPPKDA